VTGTGAVTCIGTNVDALWHNAEHGRSGIVRGKGSVADADIGHLPGNSRALDLAMKPIAEAMNRAGWQGLCAEDGLILATTTGQTPVWEKSLCEFVAKRLSRSEFSAVFRHQTPGALLTAICDRLDFGGRAMLTSSSCSASTQAIALAAMWLRQGRVRRCLVGGVEVFCDVILEGFESLKIMSAEPARPFDCDRVGINLSEGAGFLCLELDRSSSPLAVINGFGMSSDGYHMTAPHPEGRGSHMAMASALRIAELEPAQIDWIHAHGTGSHHNDLAEGTAIRTLFGQKHPPVSSTKNLHGHSLGAAGAIESILCIEALQRQTILASFGLVNADPKIGLTHPRENVKTKIRHVLKNTLGFGGTNASLILSNCEESPL
jgi:3-oxoacyl-(acyl-carrier-protein) synthase